MRITIVNPRQFKRSHQQLGEFNKKSIIEENISHTRNETNISSVLPFSKRYRHSRIDFKNLMSHEKNGIFSLDTSLFESEPYTLSKQPTKLPYFNIKNLINRSLKKKNEEKSVPKQTQKQWTSIHEKLNKPIYNKYIQSTSYSPIPTKQLTNQDISISLNLSSIIGTSRKKSLEKQKHRKEGESDRMRDLKNKTAYYINNFMRTRFKGQQNLSPIKAQKFAKLQREPSFQNNYILAWQKSKRESEEQSFIIG